MPRGNFTRSPRPALLPIGPSIAYIDLKHGHFTLISVDDLEMVNSVPWHRHTAKNREYARATIGGKKTYLHRFLFSGEHVQTDHFNGDGLNNLPHNLRAATVIQNGCNKSQYSTNTSGFKGVTWNKARGKWVAGITVNYKHKTLGYFKTPESAHAAYCEAALRLHGDFARFD